MIKDIQGLGKNSEGQEKGNKPKSQEKKKKTGPVKTVYLLIKQKNILENSLEFSLSWKKASRTEGKRFYL